ncbi:MAG: hypothetical protein ACLQPH_10035 [Acidimicrobiales bacterium]
MIRRMLVVAAVIAMPVSVIAATGGIAGAVAKVNGKPDTIICTKISGTATFKTPMHLSMSPFTEVTTIKTTLSGCTTAGPNPVTVVSGAVSGTLTNTAATGCVGLLAGSTDVGKLTTKWKTSGAMLAAPASTTIKVNSVAGGTNTVGANTYGTFGIPGSTANGAPGGPFQGSDVGAGDSTHAATVLTQPGIIAACNSAGGLKSLKLTQKNSGYAYAVSLG